MRQSSLGGAVGGVFTLDIGFDPATNIYTLTGFPGIIPNANFGDPELVSSTTSFINYSFVDPSGNTQSLRILNPAVGNPVIDLTYSSFGVRTESVPTTGGRPDEDISYFVFGVPTLFASRPTTGTATYSGIAEGVFAGGSNRFDLTGTSTLSADFGANTINTSLTLSGVERTDSTNTIDLGTFTGSGNIVQFSGSNIAGFQGNLTNTSNSLLTGNFDGSFFGPNAEEFGYSFRLDEVDASGATINVGAGAAVGVQD